MTLVHNEATYRRSYIGIWLVGTLTFVGLILTGYPILGAFVFGLAALVAINLHHRYEAPLFDERDDAIIKEASANTLLLFGVTSGVFFPTMTALYALGIYQWPTWLTPIAWFVTSLFLVFGVNILISRW